MTLLGLLDLCGLRRFGIALDAAGGKSKRECQKQEGGFHESHPFSSLSQRFASRFTFVGEVPPKLTREATEDSTVSTL